ncbi:XrtA system polysaccharide chain length determinant [Oleidesulfovibrio sp.]|uniref:XrtA system polysaccharide chain length determinant n=1 Tax=Oleidesulfovibrio sp. TaxID=2909707 RepID=UPI003A86DE7B
MDKVLDDVEAGGGLDIMRYVNLVWEHALSFWIIASLVMLLAIAYAYSLPKVYEAKSTIAIEQSVINDLVRGIAITPSMDAKIRILQVSLLSRSSLLGVMNALDMDLGLQGAALEERIAAVRSNVNVGLNEKRGLFTIAYQSTSPERARDFVNTLTRQYIEASTSDKREESFEATRFLADQIEVFRKRIEAAQSEIDAFKADRGMILNMSEPALRQEILRAQEELQILRIRKTDLLAQRGVMLRNTPLRNRLEALERELSAMFVSYTAKHPRVVRLKQEIEGLKREVSRKSEEERRAIYGTSEYQRIKVELSAVEQQEAQLLGKIEENEKLLREIPSVASELAELENRRRKESLIYEQLVGRYGQSEVSKQMELQDKAVNFRIIDPAVLPSVPVSPKRWLIILAGMAGGLGIGFGVLFIFDFLNPRIRSADELRKMGFHVMAVVPSISDVAESRRLWRRRISVTLCGMAWCCVVISIALTELMQMPYVELALSRVGTTISSWL